jgi:hypothetical protein
MKYSEIQAVANEQKKILYSFELGICHVEYGKTN